MSALVLFSGCATSSESQPLDILIPERGSLSAKIDEIVVTTGVPSVSTAVIDESGTLWAYATGRADSENRIPALPGTRYRLASVSKPITAVAIMLLADRGYIDLDAPANRYLGDSKIVTRIGDADEVTVRRLMAHRAGLPTHYNLIHAGEGIERRSLDETIELYGHVMFEPDTVHRYSNVGYGVLERIIEIQSAKAYAEFLEDELFAPLGLESALVFSGPAYPPDSAMPYTGTGELYPAYDMDTRGAGGIYMSASDLALFGKFFSDALDAKSDLLSAEAANEMLAMQSHDQIGALEYYTLGWVHELRGENREHGTIYHLGSTPGARAELWLYPDRDLIVATLVNEMNYHPLYLVREAVLADYAPDISYEPRADIAVPSSLNGKWTGTIDLGSEGKIDIEFDFSDPGAPHLSINGEDAFILRAGAMQDGLFQIETSGVSLPSVDASQQAHSIRFLLSQSDDRLTGSATTNRIASRFRDSGAFSYWTQLRREPALSQSF